jgi:hypothetical protein
MYSSGHEEEEKRAEQEIGSKPYQRYGDNSVQAIRDVLASAPKLSTLQFKRWGMAYLCNCYIQSRGRAERVWGVPTILVNSSIGFELSVVFLMKNGNVIFIEWFEDGKTVQLPTQ